MYNMNDDVYGVESILEALASSCPHVEVTDLGHGRHHIGTGFTYDDGDELRMILKRGGMTAAGSSPTRVTPPCGSRTGIPG